MPVEYTTSVNIVSICIEATSNKAAAAAAATTLDCLWNLRRQLGKFTYALLLIHVALAWIRWACLAQEACRFLYLLVCKQVEKHQLLCQMIAADFSSCVQWRIRFGCGRFAIRFSFGFLWRQRRRWHTIMIMIIWNWTTQARNCCSFPQIRSHCHSLNYFAEQTKPLRVSCFALIAFARCLRATLHIKKNKKKPTTRDYLLQVACHPNRISQTTIGNQSAHIYIANIDTKLQVKSESLNYR